MFLTVTVNEVIALFNTLIGDLVTLFGPSYLFTLCSKGDVKSSQDYKTSLGICLEIAFFSQDAATFSLSHFNVPIDINSPFSCLTEKRCACPDILSKAKRCRFIVPHMRIHVHVCPFRILLFFMRYSAFCVASVYSPSDIVSSHPLSSLK